MKNSNPEISVIIPVYNSEKYLRKSLDSVVSQTFHNFEVILIDNASKDSSLAIMNEYCNKYSNFKLYRTDKNDISEARNMGVEKAEGKYLSFIDSDDFILPNFLEILYNDIKKNNSDVSCCNYYMYWPKSNICIADILRLPSGKYSSSKILYSLIKDTQIHFFLWNKLWKKSLFTENNIKFPKSRCYEDVYACLQIFYFAKSISVISRPLYFYTRRKDSYENTFTLKKYSDYIKSFVYIRTFLELNNEYEKYRMSHTILGLRIILSSIPMIFFKRNKLSFSDFIFYTKKIRWCLSKNSGTKSIISQKV